MVFIVLLESKEKLGLMYFCKFKHIDINVMYCRYWLKITNNSGFCQNAEWIIMLFIQVWQKRRLIVLWDICSVADIQSLYIVILLAILILAVHDFLSNLDVGQSCQIEICASFYFP